MPLLCNIRNIGRDLIGKPRLDTRGRSAPSVVDESRRSFTKGMVLAGTLAASGVLPSAVEYLTRPAGVVMPVDSSLRDKLAQAWWKNFVTEPDGPKYVYDPNWKEGDPRDKIVSEGMPWGMRAARMRQDMDGFDSIEEGLRSMMGRGLPAWQGHIDTKTGQFVVSNNTAALDADLQSAIELIQASSSATSYLQRAQKFVDMIWENYVDYDGAVGSLAPTPYDRGTAFGRLKNLSYVSIAELEAIRDFDTDPSRDWQKVIDFEQAVREKAILTDHFFISKSTFERKQGPDYTAIPDWITVVAQPRWADEKIEVETQLYIPEGRSHKFGYDAVRTLLQITQDALHCKSSELRERNIRLARKMLEKFPQDVAAAIDGIVLYGYDGNALKSKDGSCRAMLYAAYGALAYAAARPLEGESADVAKKYVGLHQKLFAKVASHSPTKKYYEESLILWAVGLYTGTMPWKPRVRFSGEESKDIQKILQEDTLYLTSVLKYFPPHPGFEYQWARTPGERALLDIIPPVFATATELSWLKRKLVTNPVILSWDKDEIEANLALATQLKALWIIPGAINRYQRVLSYPQIYEYPEMLSEATSGLEGIIRENGIPPLRAVEIFRRIMDKGPKAHPYAELGMAQALLDTYEYEFNSPAHRIAYRYLGNSNPEIAAKAAQLYATASVRIAQFEGLKKNETKTKTWVAAALVPFVRVVEQVKEEIKRLGEKYGFLVWAYDRLISIKGEGKARQLRFAKLKADVLFQKAKVLEDGAKIKTRSRKERLQDLKTAEAAYGEVLKERELVPDMALSALSGLVSCLRYYAEVESEEKDGLFERREEKSKSKELNQARELVEAALAKLINPPKVPSGEIEGAVAILHDGIPHARVEADMESLHNFVIWATKRLDRREQRKIHDLVRLAELSLRTHHLGIIGDRYTDSSQALPLMAEDVGRIAEESPHSRVRALFERVVYFLEKGQTVRAQYDCESIARIASIVRENLGTPERILLSVSKEETLEQFRSLSILGRDIQAVMFGSTSSRSQSIRRLAADIENIGIGVETAKELTGQLKTAHDVNNKAEIKRYQEDIIYQINLQLTKLSRSITESEREIYSQAVEAFRTGDVETFSELLERLALAGKILADFQARLKNEGEEGRIFEELAVMERAVEIKTSANQLEWAKALYKKVATKFEDQTPYTTAWFERIIGSYLTVAWTVFNESNIDGKEVAIAMMKRLLNEDHRHILKNNPKIPRAVFEMVQIIDDIESRGFIEVILSQQPQTKRDLQVELGDMLSYDGADRDAARRYFRAALGLPEDPPEDINKEALQYKLTMGKPQNADIVEKILNTYSADTQEALRGGI